MKAHPTSPAIPKPIDRIRASLQLTPYRSVGLFDDDLTSLPMWDMICQENSLKTGTYQERDGVNKGHSGINPHREDAGKPRLIGSVDEGQINMINCSLEKYQGLTGFNPDPGSNFSRRIK